MPFLISRLGGTSFGYLSIAQAIQASLIIFINFGFNYSGVKEASTNLGNKTALASIAINISSVRLAIAIIASIIFLVIAPFWIPKETLSTKLHIVFALSLCGWAIFPDWFFQGIKTFKTASFIGISTRALMIIPTFFVIKSPSDLWLVFLFQSIGYIGGGLFAFLLISKTYPITISSISPSRMATHLYISAPFFATTVMASIYRNASTLLLGSFAHPSLVGQYAAAEKITKSIQTLFDSFSRAIFPQFANDSGTHNTQQLAKKYKHQITIILYAALIICASLMIGAPFLTKLVYSNDGAYFLYCLAVTSPIIVFGMLSSIFGWGILVNTGNQKWFLSFVMIMCIISLSTNLLFVKYHLTHAIPITFLITEIILGIAVAIKVYTSKQTISKVLH